MTVSYEEQEALRAYIAERAEGAPNQPAEDCCWVRGADELPNDADCDEFTDFCPRCVNYEIRRLKKKYRKLMKKDGLELAIDRGNGVHECDSPPHCDICGILLGCSLTNYGVEQELEAIGEDGYLGDDPRAWAELSFVVDYVYDENHWEDVKRMVRRARAKSRFDRQTL